MHGEYGYPTICFSDIKLYGINVSMLMLKSISLCQNAKMPQNTVRYRSIPGQIPFFVAKRGSVRVRTQPRIG